MFLFPSYRQALCEEPAIGYWRSRAAPRPAPATPALFVPSPGAKRRTRWTSDTHAVPPPPPGMFAFPPAAPGISVETLASSGGVPEKQGSEFSAQRGIQLGRHPVPTRLPPKMTPHISLRRRSTPTKHGKGSIPAPARKPIRPRRNRVPVAPPSPVPKAPFVCPSQPYCEFAGTRDTATRGWRPQRLSNGLTAYALSVPQKQRCCIRKSKPSPVYLLRHACNRLARGPIPSASATELYRLSHLLLNLHLSSRILPTYPQRHHAPIAAGHPPKSHHSVRPAARLTIVFPRPQPTPPFPPCRSSHTRSSAQLGALGSRTQCRLTGLLSVSPQATG